MIAPGGINSRFPTASDGNNSGFGWRNNGPRIPIGATDHPGNGPVLDSPMGRMIGPNQAFAGGPGGTLPGGNGSDPRSGFGGGGSGTFGIEPDPLPGAGGGGGIPGAGEPGGLGGPPIGGIPPDPFQGAHGGVGNNFGSGPGGFAGGQGGFGWRQIGPGTIFGNAQPGGTNLAYPTSSYWDSSLNNGAGGWVAAAQSAGGAAPGFDSSGWNTQLAMMGLGGAMGKPGNVQI